MKKIIISIATCASLFALDIAHASEQNIKQAAEFSYKTAVNSAKSALINIEYLGNLSDWNVFSEFANDSFFSDFNPMPNFPINLQGSGVVISKDGYIITSALMLDGARKITANIAGNSQELELIGVLPELDLALLKAPSKLESSAQFVSANPEAGDVHLAILRGKNSIVQTGFGLSSDTDNKGIFTTSAPVVAGSMIIDTKGGFLGMATSLLRGSQHVILSASSIEKALNNMINMHKNKSVSRFPKEQSSPEKFSQKPSIASAELKDEYLGMKLVANGYALKVLSVQKDSEAASAGIEAGDLLMAVNSYDISSIEDFNQALKKSSGKYVKLWLKRGGLSTVVVINKEEK